MNIYVFDIEADGLLEDATKIHCLCYWNLIDSTTGSLTSPNDIKEFIENADVLIGHNIVRYDLPLLELLVGAHVRLDAVVVDTLALSWYLYPERNLHGLESWGDDFGVPKPVVNDWKNLSQEEYIHRCEEDVKINVKLWKKQRRYLEQIYGSWEEAKKLIEYLTFKMDCAREQERSKWRLDKDYALESLRKLTDRRLDKLATLGAAMPQMPVYALRKRPEKPYKKDGTLSVAGSRWFHLLEEQGLPPDHQEDVKELIRYEPPNPGSPIQVKDWLFSLGWKPITFKFVKEENGTVRKIPQINLEHGGGLCPSVYLLIPRNPAIGDLEELGVISHRISLLNGFLASVDSGGFVQAQVAGLTNTLRFKHKTVVNLPKVGKPYGEEIRGALIAREGYELCGSDMSGLEDRLKQHFIYPYDPEYVKEMSTDDYDPHLSLALLAKEVSPEQVQLYKSGEDKSIKPIRDIFKNGNYACQYGAGPPRLALTADISLEKAEQVWKTYWEKNWAIKKVAEQQIVKTIKDQMWLYNPISKLWYSLRYEKDRFSTLIQGTASFVFDEWVGLFRSKRPQLTAQFHDEVVIEIKKGFRDKAEKLLRGAIAELNNNLQLNRELGIDVQFGNRYSDIH
jgi:hypothetical protein